MRQPKIHAIKVWSVFYEAIKNGSKTFEIRKNDRGYLPGDYLQLMEYDNRKQSLTGAEMFKEVPYIIYGPDWGLPADMCVMSIREPDGNWYSQLLNSEPAHD